MRLVVLRGSSLGVCWIGGLDFGDGVPQAANHQANEEGVYATERLETLGLTVKCTLGRDPRDERWLGPICLSRKP